MTKPTILIFITVLGITSCIVPKESRMLKKNTKDWREASTVLEGYADSPLSGSFLTLRENGKFEHTSSGMIKSFQAGNWTNNGDTITLSYVNENQTLTKEQTVTIDRKTSTLVFNGDDTPVQMRMKIMVNKI